MKEPPNPLVPCGRCLWNLGLGYDRISRLLFGSQSKRHRVYKWRKYHNWPPHIDPLWTYIKTKRIARPPKLPRTKLSNPEVVQRQESRFSKRSKRQLRVYLLTTINQCLKHGLYPNAVPRLVGCSTQSLRTHLESLFQAEMNWSNYGSYWELDHKIPVNSFNIHDRQQRLACFHFTNLQPLSKHQNRKKSTKIDLYQNTSPNADCAWPAPTPPYRSR